MGCFPSSPRVTLTASHPIKMSLSRLCSALPIDWRGFLLLGGGRGLTLCVYTAAPFGLICLLPALHLLLFASSTSKIKPWCSRPSNTIPFAPPLQRGWIPLLCTDTAFCSCLCCCLYSLIHSEFFEDGD